MIYIFDMDGPLTKSRQPMLRKHKERLAKFLRTHRCLLVSGSSSLQINHQLLGIKHLFHQTFPVSGNAAAAEFTDKTLSDYLNDLWSLSCFEFKEKPHTEIRTGAWNFTVAGHGGDLELREMFAKYDAIVKERLDFVKRLTLNFPKYEFCIGGSVSIDIYPRGKSKVQILRWLPTNSQIMFFCDTPEQFGGDHSLAQAVLEQGGDVVKTTSVEQTLSCLATL